MKRLRILLILTIFFIPTIVFAENLTPSVDTSKKIYDYADLLTDEEESELFEKVDSFIDKYNMDLVLVTLDKNPYGVSDAYTEVYAQDFYDYNDFGKGSTHDGLIILIDMDNRYPFIVTTGSAIIMFDDNRIEKIHDYAYDYLADGRYYAAFNAYVDKVTSYASDGVPSSNELLCVGIDGTIYKCKEKPKAVNWAISLIAASVLSFLPVLIHLRKYKGIKLATNANTYLEKVEKGPNVDQFLTTFTSRIRRSHDDNSSGGGGKIGGSTIKFGSSGRSHGGGGGRHF